MALPLYTIRHARYTALVSDSVGSIMGSVCCLFGKVYGRKLRGRLLQHCDRAVFRGVYRYGKSYRYAYLYRIVVPVFCTGIPCCCWSQPCRHLPFTSSPISFSRPPFMLQSGLAWKKPDRPEWRRNRRSWVSWHTDYCFFLLIVLTSDTPKYCRRRTFFSLWRHSLPLPSVYFK